MQKQLCQTQEQGRRRHNAIRLHKNDVNNNHEFKKTLRSAAADCANIAVLCVNKLLWASISSTSASPSTPLGAQLGEGTKFTIHNSSFKLHNS